MKNLVLHLIFGNDPDAIERAIRDQIQQALASIPEADRHLSIQRFDLAEAGVKQMSMENADPYLALKTGHLLPGPSVVIWESADILFDLSEEPRWFPARAIENAAPGAVLIIQCKKFIQNSEVGLSIAQAIAMTGDGSVTECSTVGPFDRDGKAALIRRIAVESGVADRLKPEAEKELAAICSGSAQDSRLMLTRLRDATGTQQIGLPEVRMHCKGKTTAFDFMDCVIAGNHGAALRCVQQMHASQDLKNFRALQGALAYCVKRAALVICSPSDLSRANDAWGLKISSGAAKRIQGSCSPDRIFAIWDVLTEWESDEINSGVEDNRRRMEKIADCAFVG